MLFKHFLTLFYFKGIKKIVWFNKIAGPLLLYRYKKMASSEACGKAPLLPAPCAQVTKPKQGKICKPFCLSTSYLEKLNLDRYYDDTYVEFLCIFLKSSVVLVSLKQDTEWDTTWFILYQFQTSREHVRNCSCYWRQNPVQLVKAVPRAKPAGLKSFAA